MTTATDRYRTNLEKLTLDVNARRVLEIGGGSEGVSGRAFCGALGPGGELWTIDINANHPPLAAMAEAELQTGCRWRKVVGDSLVVDVGVICSSNPFDLLYIDGDHEHAHAFGDFERFKKFVRPGGVIVFDDFGTKEGVNSAVREAEAWGWSGVALRYDYEANNSHYVLRVPG